MIAVLTGSNAVMLSCQKRRHLSSFWVHNAATEAFSSLHNATSSALSAEISRRRQVSTKTPLEFSPPVKITMIFDEVDDEDTKDPAQGA